MNVDAKGITIEFRGNSVQFSNTIDGINKALKLLSKDVKALNKELKIDPKNLDALGNKFNDLREKEALLKEQLDKYNKAIAEMPAIKTNEDMAELVKLQKGLADTETELKRLEEQMTLFGVQSVENFGKSLDELGDKLEEIGDGITQVGKSLAVFSAGATALLTLGTKYNSELEQIQIGFTTITGSEEEALAVMQEIRKEAQSVPFGVSELMQYNRMLMATGVSAEESQKVILALGDAISATGGSSYEFERMVQNLQQIKQAGGSTARDIKQFAYAYIDIYGILSDYLGKDATEMEASEITYKHITNALIKASQEGGKYYGAMERQSQSLAGQITKLKDDFSLMTSELVESLMPVIKEIIQEIRDFTAKVKELSPFTKEIIADILVFVAVLSPLLIGLGKIVKTIGTLTKFIGGILTNKGLLTALAKAGGSLTTLVAPILAIVGAVGLLIQAFIHQYQESENFRNKLAELGTNIINDIMPILIALKGIFDVIANKLKIVVAPVIQALSIMLEDAILPMLSNLWDLIATYLLPILADVGELLSGGLNVAFNLIADVLGVICIVVETIVGFVKILLDRIAQSEQWKQVLTFLQNVLDFITAIIDALKSVFNWITAILGKAGDWISTGISSVASLFGGSGGFGQESAYSSGGFNTNVTINVTNSGSEISRQMVMSWADMITDRVNENLGNLI